MFGSLRSSPFRLSTQFISTPAFFYKSQSFTYSTAAAMSNVYFDVSAGGSPLGRIVLYVPLLQRHVSVSCCWRTDNNPPPTSTAATATTATAGRQDADCGVVSCTMMPFPRRPGTSANWQLVKTATYDLLSAFAFAVGV